MGIPDEPRRPLTANSPERPSTRQRGFYSECLDSEMDPERNAQLLAAASCGPRTLDLQPRFPAPRAGLAEHQRLPLPDVRDGLTPSIAAQRRSIHLQS